MKPEATESLPMRMLRRLGRDDLAWSLRRLFVPVDRAALVLEVGSGGNPFPRANVLLDAYENTRERHYQPLITDRPTVLGLVENMPFRDDAFDFVIACHVIEHSTDMAACIAELQRVATAGYIECPDAFFERINPYKDHRYEVTERDGVLVTRRKEAWVADRDLVDLYEYQVKNSSAWRRHLRSNPFPMHVRYFWSRSTGGIRHTDKSSTPALRPFEAGPDSPPSSEHGSLRARAIAALRAVLSQRARNRRIELLGLLRCVRCHSEELAKDDSAILCTSCRARYSSEPIPRMLPVKEPESTP